jgi:hypothetical protein
VNATQIEQLARQAGIGFGVTHIGPDGEERWASVTDGELARFAELVQAETLLSADFYKLVRAAALEEAATACDAMPLGLANQAARARQHMRCATAIRALAQQAGGEQGAGP